MIQQTKQPECCGQKVAWRKNNGEIEFLCKTCGKSGSGSTTEEAVNNFNNSNKKNLITIPEKPQDFPVWAQQKMNDLVKSSAMFLERPAVARMIEKNVNYILKTDLKKCWDSQEGRLSIIEEFKESLWYGSVMPDMGCIVPYGKKAKFIPSKDTFMSALTQTNRGIPPLLKSINAEAIYENDICDGPKSVNGEFMYSNQQAIGDRGEIRSIVVCYYDNNAGGYRGKTLSKKSLIDGAEKHSEAHKAYMRDVRRFNEMRSEGKTDFLNGREYYIKDIEKKDGTIWPKKIFIDELTSLYAEGDPDQEKMLIKAALKNALKDKMKELNALAIKSELGISDIEENRSTEKMLDDCLNTAAAQVAPQPEPPTQDKIKDAEFEIDQGEMFDPDSIEY